MALQPAHGTGAGSSRSAAAPATHAAGVRGSLVRLQAGRRGRMSILCQHSSCSQQAAPSWGVRLASMGLAASVAAAALCCQPAAAAAAMLQQPRQHLAAVLMDTSSGGNAAIMGELKRLRQTKERYGAQDPGSALSDRLLAVQDQLQRIQLLVQLKQYDNARMQLREGPFKNLRGELRYAEEYRGLGGEVARSVVQGVEQLDGQLRRRDGLDAIKPALKQLQQQLQQVAQEAQR